MKENPFYQEETLCNDNNSYNSNNVGSCSYTANGKIKNNDRQFPYIIKIEEQSKAFPQLSSISVNSTDDYFLTSGFGKSVALYNVCSGSLIKLLPDMHMSHINVVRFTNYHPHIFSTVSFDSTCKIWDLRQKIQGNDPVIKFELPCMAIMSCFTPKNDLKMVVSGIDNYMKELDLRSKEICRQGFEIPSLRDDRSFRRSLYNSSGDIIYTINTKDRYIRGYSSLDYNLSFSFNTSHFYEHYLNKCESFSPSTNCNEDDKNKLSCSRIYTILEGKHTNFDNIYSINELQYDISNNQEQNSLQRSRNDSINDNINMQSVRAHPIFNDIGGILVSGSDKTIFSKPKIVLMKFDNSEIKSVD